MNWLERARGEIQKSAGQSTANSADGNLTAAMAVPNRTVCEKSPAFGKAESVAKPVADPWADYAAAFRLGWLHQCRVCRHFTDAVPPDGDTLGVQDAGWCKSFNVATHPLQPFYCHRYTPWTH